MNDYTRTAITILEKMKQELPVGLLAYWVTPNVILTLSGARAYADSVNWSDDEKVLDTWRQEMEQSYEVLKRHAGVFDGIVRIEEPRNGERLAGFDIVLWPGLRKVLKETKIINEKDGLPDDIRTTDALMEWLRQAVSRGPEGDRIHDEETLNHIAFGILVGYPDVAILEEMLRESDPRRDPFAEQSVAADIRGCAYYICPQPFYSYPRHLMADPAIREHEELWSTILREYYTSDFHKALEADEHFQAKLKELDMLWEG